MKIKFLALVVGLMMVLSACGYDSHVYHSHTVHYVHSHVTHVHVTHVHLTHVQHVTVHRTIVSKPTRVVTSYSSRPTVSLKKR
jgi:hypothetical protein